LWFRSRRAGPVRFLRLRIFREFELPHVRLSWGDISLHISNVLQHDARKAVSESLVPKAEGVLFSPYAYINRPQRMSGTSRSVFRSCSSCSGDKRTVRDDPFLQRHRFAYFSWKNFKTVSPAAAPLKAFWLTRSWGRSGFFTSFSIKRIFIVLGPLVLAAYYFLVRPNLKGFIVSSLLLCLVSEDAALFLMSFSFYIFVFERKSRLYAYVAAGMSAAYLALVLLVVQPGVTPRHDRGSRLSSRERFKKFQDDRVVAGGNGARFPAGRLFCFSFVVADCCSRGPECPLRKIVGLLFLAPLSIGWWNWRNTGRNTPCRS